jgi:hypothetical protein
VSGGSEPHPPRREGCYRDREVLPVAAGVGGIDPIGIKDEGDGVDGWMGGWVEEMAMAMVT